MKVLVTGSKGMLAHDLIPVLSEGHEVISPSEEDLDITKRDITYHILKRTSPDVVINCAAYTQVDKAEEERGKAFLVNGIGVQNIALACQDIGIPLCHLSTDYVFDGAKMTPYTPFDNTNPVNAYGESKLAGEKYIQWITDRFYIVRTSWLYGKAGNNFVSKILRLSGEKKELRVVADQRGSPTSTVTLSRAIAELIRSGAYGIHHFTDATDGGISWCDFAEEIVKLSGNAVKVVPVTSDEFPSPARRPAHSVLDTSLFPLVTGYRPTNWKKTLKTYLLNRIHS
ncbi:MAG TPA: dTDP-4-dehydrorhamnose reductase [Thermodesulfovibrionales bacterium]|nr:dTDP-4-dehydrorhamnose reductase [Thermodesulfovibrionales bacterium]